MINQNGRRINGNLRNKPGYRNGIRRKVVVVTLINQNLQIQWRKILRIITKRKRNLTRARLNALIVINIVILLMYVGLTKKIGKKRLT